jgi:hypothetical protein
MCRFVSFEILMMFTTTISASSMCRISSGVIVPIVCLYITVVVVVILFSIIVSCLFISLSFVCVGIIYDMAGTRVNAFSIICWMVRTFSLMPVLLCM